MKEISNSNVVFVLYHWFPVNFLSVTVTVCLTKINIKHNNFKKRQGKYREKVTQNTELQLQLKYSQMLRLLTVSNTQSSKSKTKNNQYYLGKKRNHVIEISEQGKKLSSKKIPE